MDDGGISDLLDFPKTACSIARWLKYIVSLGITLWIGLSFKVTGPRCYIHELYVPALDLSQSSPNNASIINPCLFFDMSFANIIDDHSIQYGNINLTFSYQQNVVANYTVPGFYQGKGKTAQRREVVETHGMLWEDAMSVVSNGSKAVIRVDMRARPKFRFWFWYTKRKGVRIGANVEVDGSGMKVGKDKIRLNAVSRPRMGVFVLLLSVFCYFLFVAF